MDDFIDLPDEIYRTACKILYKHWDVSRAVRLVGITLGNLMQWDYIRCDVFGERMRMSRLAWACDRIKDRFGEKAVLRGYH